MNRAPSGVPVASLLGRNLVDFVAPPFRADVRSCLASVGAGEPARRRLIQVELPDGTRSWYATTTAPVEQAGRIVAITVAARDVAPQRSLGNQPRVEPLLPVDAEHWRQIQRLELVGLLAAGLVHDLNNVLAAIDSSVHGLLALLPADDPARPDAENVQNAVRHGTSVTQRLLELARGKAAAQRQRIDLNSVVNDVVVMAGLFLDRRVRLETSLDPSGAPVTVHRGEMEQVLFNLLLNARDAMPQGGSILISTGRLAYSAATAPRGCKLRGAVVRLRIEDSGTGIDDATIARVFEPFFTTKSPNRGTGLGLPTVNAIVKESGGCVELASRVGAGTTVDVVLPDADRVGRQAA